MSFLGFLASLGHPAAVVAGILLVLVVAWEAFETIVLPRTVSRKLRLTTLYFDSIWRVGFKVLKVLDRRPAARESLLAVVGPLALIALIALWSLGIIIGFACIQWGLATPMSSQESGFWTCLYVSAATFFTLGYGDIVAVSGLGRGVSMIEAGIGFGTLALVISYVPVLYQAYSARERVSLMLDARAGSPPAGVELLVFYGDDLRGLQDLLSEFERWGASLLETYLSYPILATYRSQHEMLSWIASLTCVCDACTLVQTAYQDDSKELESLKRQARSTYAMLRHLAVDLSYILRVEPVSPPVERLNNEIWPEIVDVLKKSGAPVCPLTQACENYSELRDGYEPFAYGLSRSLYLMMPPIYRPIHERASWEKSAWDEDRHF